MHIANRPQYAFWFLLWLLTAIALLLRLYHLGYNVLWYDEIGQVLVAQNSWWQTIIASVQHAGNTPLDYLITHWMLKVGNDEAILRLPSVIWGALAVALAGYLGRRLYGPIIGITTAWLMAIMPMHIEYSQELRFYTLATFLALLTLFCFWLAQEEGSWFAWIRFGVVLAVGYYAHYYLALVAAALFVWLLIYRRQSLFRFVVVAGIATLLFVPWVYFDNVVHSPATFGLATADLRLYGRWPKILIGPFIFVSQVSPQLDHIPIPVWMLVFTTWGLLGLGTIWSFFGRRHRDIVLLGLLTGVGMAGLLTLDWYGNYVFSGRQTLIFLPYLLLGAFGVLARVLAQLHIRQWLVALIAFVIVLASSLTLSPWIQQVYVTGKNPGRLPEVGLLLQRYIKDGDRIVVAHPAHIGYYMPQLTPYFTNVNSESIDTFIKGLAEKHIHIWIIPWGPNPALQLHAWAVENQVWDVAPWPDVQLFVYSTGDSDAGLKVGQQIHDSIAITEEQRMALAEKLASQLTDRGRFSEAQPFLEEIRGDTVTPSTSGASIAED